MNEIGLLEDIGGESISKIYESSANVFRSTYVNKFRISLYRNYLYHR